MKQLIVAIIACLVVIGCGQSISDITGNYVGKVDYDDSKLNLEIKSNGQFIMFHDVDRDDRQDWYVGNWKTEEDLIIISGKREQDEAISTIKFDKKSFKIRSWIRGNESLLPNKKIDNLVFQKMSVLASCFTCKEKVSRNAEVCPHCGEPNPVKN
jgi:hypothetical protein